MIMELRRSVTTGETCARSSIMADRPALGPFAAVLPEHPAVDPTLWVPKILSAQVSGHFGSLCRLQRTGLFERVHTVSDLPLNTFKRIPFGAHPG